MTSDARAIELISEHFLREWPLMAIGVPCVTAGPAHPPEAAASWAHLSTWIGLFERRGASNVRLWVPLQHQVTGTLALAEAARAIFDDLRLPCDDGTIAMDRGKRFDIGEDGARWQSAVVFGFQIR